MLFRSDYQTYKTLLTGYYFSGGRLLEGAEMLFETRDEVFTVGWVRASLRAYQRQDLLIQLYDQIPVDHPNIEFLRLDEKALYATDAEIRAEAEVLLLQADPDNYAGSIIDRLFLMGEYELIKELINTPELRPAITQPVIDDFLQRCQRLLPDYGPESETEWVDWLQERTLMPLTEWLQHSAHQDLASARILQLKTPSFEGIIAADMAASVLQGFYPDQPVTFTTLAGEAWTPTDVDDRDPDLLLETLLGNWLQYYGPKIGRAYV